LHPQSTMGASSVRQPPAIWRLFCSTAVLLAARALPVAGFGVPQSHPNVALRAPNARQQSSAPSRLLFEAASVVDAPTDDATTVLALSLPMADSTRATVALSRETCKGLVDQVNELITSFRTKSDGRKPSFEFEHASAPLRLEMECNPNIFADPFKARVSVRLVTADLEVTSEMFLTVLVDALRTTLAPKTS